MARKQPTADQKAASVRYFAPDTAPESCLANGTFVRQYPSGNIVRYRLGDYIGECDRIPDGMVEVPLQIAVAIVPQCCK